MFEWLPEVCRDINGKLTELYWILIGPLVLFLIILEFFKFPEKPVGASNIIRRAVISVILLMTFENITNLVAFFADGITGFLEGPVRIRDLLGVLKQKTEEYEAGFFDFKEHIVLFFSLLSYLIAYLGVFIPNAIIHFVTGLLYCVSPLMILCYCSERTSFICSNLYKGILSVATWKILWSILGVFLLKLATHPLVGDWGNIFTAIVVNICIGGCMLFIPLFTKSLLSDGLVSAAGGMAMAPTLVATGGAKAYLAKRMRSGVGMMGRHIGRPLWKGVGGTAVQEGKKAFSFASELGRMDKAVRYSKGKFRDVKHHITEGRKTTADFIRQSMGFQTQKPVLPKNVIQVDFKNKKPK